MKEYSKELSGLTIGLDLGNRHSYWVMLDAEGEILDEGRVRTRVRQLQRIFGKIPSSRVALEVGTQSSWVSRLLSRLGHEVIVANGRKLRLIYQNPKKQDRVDAEYLARLARADVKLLEPIEHRSEETQVDLQVIKTRRNLIRARTRLINHVRSSMKVYGVQLSSCSARAFAQKVQFEIPERLQPTMNPVVQMIARLSEQIRQYDQQIEDLSKQKYPQTALLRQIKGVGPLTALTYVLVIENPERFERSRDVGPYLGLCPGKDQSGERDPELRISKAGDRLLRSLLVNCAHYVLGHFGEDSDLRRHGEKIAARGGKKAKKRAVVAVARKMAVLLHHLWVTGEVYEPLYRSEPSRIA
jgi:transposase